MSEYRRLNEMIDTETERMEQAKAAGDLEAAYEIECGIGEIKGALLEMAETDGLDDPNEAFDSYWGSDEEWYDDMMQTTSDWDRR